jgi:hypothetical protein
MLLDLDLQLFAEGEDDLDLDSMMEEFESEWNDEDERNPLRLTMSHRMRKNKKILSPKKQLIRMTQTSINGTKRFKRYDNKPKKTRNTQTSLAV